MKGKINIDIPFPVININKFDYSLIITYKDLTTCNDAYLDYFKNNSSDNFMIDSHGVLYKIMSINKLGYTNFFLGLNLRTLSKTYNADVILNKKEVLSNEKLKLEGEKIIKSKKDIYNSTLINLLQMKDKFENLTEREDILRYLFYFMDPSYFESPENENKNWRISSCTI